MKEWVRNEVYPPYVNRFTRGGSNMNGTESEEEGLRDEIPKAELDKVYYYFRNNCKVSKSSINVKVTSPSSHHLSPRHSSPHPSSTSIINDSDDDDDFEDDPDIEEDNLPPSRRTRGLREIIAEDYQEMINAELHPGSEKLGRKIFFRKWNDIITKIIKDMPQKKLDEYIAKANKFRDESKKPPSREETLRWQKYLPITASMYLWRLLGWKRKQYGDAVIFLSTAVRRPSGKISTKRYLISNVGKHTDKEEDFYKVWDNNGRGQLGILAEEWLPHHDKQDAPLLSQSLSGKYFVRPFDPDTVTAKEMRAVLSQYMTKNWEASGRAGSIPWSTMETPESRAPYCVDHKALHEYPNLNPSSMKSEKVIPLAAIFSANPTISLFEGPLNSNPTSGQDQPIVNLPSVAVTPDDSDTGTTQCEPATPPVAALSNYTDGSIKPATTERREDHTTGASDGHTAGSATSSPDKIPQQSRDPPTASSPQRTPSPLSKARSPEGPQHSQAHRSPKVQSPPVIHADSPPKTPSSTNAQQLLSKTPRTPSPKQRLLATSPRVSSPLRRVLAVGNLSPSPKNGASTGLARRPPAGPALRLVPLSRSADRRGDESAAQNNPPLSGPLADCVASAPPTPVEAIIPFNATPLPTLKTVPNEIQANISVPKKRKSSPAENKSKKRKIVAAPPLTRPRSERVSRPPQPISATVHKGQESSKRKPGYYYQDSTGGVVFDSSGLSTAQHGVGQSRLKAVNGSTKPVTKKVRRKI